MKHVPAALLLAVLAVLGVASPALAHTELIDSDPADGAALPVAPHQLRLTFNGPVQSELSTVSITGPSGTQWTVGEPTVQNTVVTVPVDPVGPAGPYAIGYRVVSADGHPVRGTVRFTLTVPASDTPATSPTPGQQTLPAPPASSGSDGGTTPVWPWMIGAAVLLGIGLVLAIRLGRSTRS